MKSSFRVIRSEADRDQRRLMSSLKYLSVLHICLQKYEVMISSDSTRQEMSMLPKGVKKILELFISLTCSMLKIALNIKLQFYLKSALSVEISSLVSKLRCIAVIISVGITLVASILSAWRQNDSY